MRFIYVMRVCAYDLLCCGRNMVVMSCALGVLCALCVNVLTIMYCTRGTFVLCECMYCV